jgi:putative SOS response-associated peptidase YedK
LAGAAPAQRAGFRFLLAIPRYASAMISRFTNRFTWGELAELYRIAGPFIAPAADLRPRYNFAPLQTGIVIRLDGEGRLEPAMMRWGLIPHDADNESGAAKRINAIAETVATEPDFRNAFESRPCLVPADGFYAWQERPGRTAQPWFVTSTFEEPFAFAGLWECWRPKGSTVLETFAILTTEPNSLCAPLGGRMPVMLAQDDWRRWLGAPAARTTLLRSFPAECMECWPVGNDVAELRNDGPGLLCRSAVSNV